MYRLVAVCVLVLTATATDAAAAEQLRPAPGTPDPKLMALVAADLGGARVTAQHYYKDRDFSSTISYSREFEDGRVGSTALVYVDSEVEMGTSAQVSATYVSTLRSVLGTKKGRAAFVNAFSSDELVSKPTLGRPRRLGVGSDSVDVPLTFRILGVKTEAHFAVFAVDQALGTVILIGVPGRHAPLAVVDYAHTPDALRKALLAARAHCAGRLAVVFGCGGERDAGKRPIMGAIAAEFADDIVITDDNPRNESPEAITREIAAGIPAGRPYRIEHDRGRAIRDAVIDADADDVVVIAGKGHEDYQVYGQERRHFSDQKAVAGALAARGGGAA